MGQVNLTFYFSWYTYISKQHQTLSLYKGSEKLFIHLEGSIRKLVNHVQGDVHFHLTSLVQKLLILGPTWLYPKNMDNCPFLGVKGFLVCERFPQERFLPERARPCPLLPQKCSQTLFLFPHSIFLPSCLGLGGWALPYIRLKQEKQKAQIQRSCYVTFNIVDILRSTMFTLLYLER